MIDRLYKLEENIKELEKFRINYKVDDLINNIQIEWILRYGLFESIQIIIDICCHLVVKFNIGNAKSYSECIELMCKENYIGKEICERLLKMVGLRNIIVHEYISVDPKKLYSMLDFLDDFRNFVKQIKNLI
ncbi:MAG: DUF86 domain-containing protein [Ignavibacterium sp.]|nr:DUF86 domain-containing protein [Ignavibacterium sp.]MDW8374847.1 DUF86 domain-containing protein [Ignavibacteriales bacterium]